MRLSKKLSSQLLQHIYNVFGQVDVYLFGSRTDDNKKGGDIDLAIDSELPTKDFKAAKTKLMTLLIRNNLTDINLDITQLNKAEKQFKAEIERTKIKLTSSSKSGHQRSSWPIP